jgi:hypothetical protein
MMLQHSGPPSTSSQAGVASASTVAGTVHMVGEMNNYHVAITMCKRSCMTYAGPCGA